MSQPTKTDLMVEENKRLIEYENAVTVRTRSEAVLAAAETLMNTTKNLGRDTTKAAEVLREAQATYEAAANASRDARTRLVCAGQELRYQAVDDAKAEATRPVTKDHTVNRGRGVTALLLWCDHQKGSGPPMSPGLDKLDIHETAAYVRALEDALESRGVRIEKATLGPFGA